MPKISVIVYSYNFNRYIGECLQSLVSQILKPWEIIVVDDCSNDGSWETISEFASHHLEIIKAFRTPYNLGPVEVTRLAMSKPRGELLSWMDGDDRWTPEKLKFEWDALTTAPWARIAYSNVAIIDEKGQRTKIWYDGTGKKPASGNLLTDVFARRCFPGINSAFRNFLAFSDAFEKVGGIDETLENFWDWDEKIRLTSIFKAIYSNSLSVEYRVHNSANRTYAAGNMPGFVKSMIKIYKKHQHLLDNLPELERVWVQANVESQIAREMQILEMSLRDPFFRLMETAKRNILRFQNIAHLSANDNRYDFVGLFSGLLNDIIQIGPAEIVLPIIKPIVSDLSKAIQTLTDAKKYVNFKPDNNPVAKSIA